MFNLGESLYEPQRFTESQLSLAIALFEFGAFKVDLINGFRLKIHHKYPNAPVSPVYYDLRILQRYPEAMEHAVNVYHEILSSLEFDIIAGIPSAATPLATAYSYVYKVGMVTPRMDNKEHGTGVRVDGLLPNGEDRENMLKVVVLDDLITHSESKLEAISILQEAGFRVEDIVVLMDKEQGGREELEKAGFNLHAAFTSSQLLQFYVETKRTSTEQYQQIREKLARLNEFLTVLS